MVKKARPPIHEPPENASRMLAMAKSDLSVARDGKKSDDTLYETLCTSCQQSIEKSFKALMIHHKVPYPAEHSITKLIDEMEKQQIILPDEIKTSA
ncbi:MAG: HEPN domain-containing protein, partial [Methanoregula sp.]